VNDPTWEITRAKPPTLPAVFHATVKAHIPPLDAPTMQRRRGSGEILYSASTRGRSSSSRNWE